MKKEFLNLLKATRLERTLIPISSIILVTGFANKITLDILILMICCILVYAIGGIFNAKIDKDFKLKHSNLTIIILSVLSIVLSLYNYIIFFTVLVAFLLAFIYSRYSRFFLFGDSIILSVTHSALPILSASLLLNLNLKLIFTLSTFMFFSTALIIPIKNLNGVEKDKKNKYVTLPTKYKNGKKITHLLLQFYFIFMFLAYFIFNLTNKFLFVILFVFIIQIFINYSINNKKEILAYKLTRLIGLLFTFAFVFDKASNIFSIFFSLSIILIYSGYLFFTIKNGKL